MPVAAYMWHINKLQLLDGQYRCSQVDLDVSHFATAEFGLDFNILCRLYDNVQFSHRLGFSLIIMYGAGNDGFKKPFQHSVE